MKKVFSLFIVITCIVCFCTLISASNIDQVVITIGNTDVVFDNDSTFTIEEKTVIAELLVYGPCNSQTYGLICNLFGHKTSTEIVTTITHEFSETSPRCLREKWEITTCSRCDYSETERISYAMIHCCP